MHVFAKLEKEPIRIQFWKNANNKVLQTKRISNVKNCFSKKIGLGIANHAKFGVLLFSDELASENDALTRSRIEYMLLFCLFILYENAKHIQFGSIVLINIRNIDLFFYWFVNVLFWKVKWTILNVVFHSH